MKHVRHTTTTTQSPQTTMAALRVATGPGFQAGGPSDATLRLIAKQTKH